MRNVALREIAIEDRYKSLPSGTLQDQPAGAKLPLLTFADEMISKSDNTAADHLLFTVGRAAVEAMLTTTGHHDPTVNQPFLSTRELFTLKLMLSPAEQQAFVGSTLAAKRTLLDDYDARLDPRTYAGPEPTAPILPDTLEWFATPGDLCRVMAARKGYADKPATTDVYDVLRINPGFADHAGAFAYIGMKGGSEPGVLDLTWLLQRKRDSKWLFLTADRRDQGRLPGDGRARDRRALTRSDGVGSRGLDQVRGHVTVNVVPRSRLDSTAAVPPCALAISLTMKSPRPTLRPELVEWVPRVMG